MTRYMLIDALHPEETRVVITENKQILDFDFVTSAKKQIKGNIYLAKVTRVEPSLQAAFVEYGGNKQGFLPFSEIHPDYYQIPVSDRKRLLEEEEALAREQEEDNYGADNNGDDDNAPITGGNGGNSRRGGGRRRRRRGRYQAAAREEESVAAEVEEKPESREESTVDYGGEPSADSDSDNASADNAGGGDVDDDGTEGITGSSDGTTDSDGTDGSDKGSEEISTLGDDEDIGRKRRRGQYNKRYKIQEVIKRNQIILVQVIKEERGNKGVSLSTYISLAGRYCVLMPNSPRAGGISRKISGNDDRKRLKKIIQDLQTARGMSVIVRTAGMDRTRAEIKRDFDYLVKLWNQIREDTLSSTAPAMVYEESDIIKRALRDLYNSDIDRVLVEGEQAYRTAKDFMKMMMPSHAARIKHYKDHPPLFSEYDVEPQLATMYDPSVKLRSGGYIVINPTEALISIDVNSGRSTAERNIEETASKTNLEAAREIARQLRLRDLAGLIVIDFIDMMDGKNRRAVERAMREALKYDRAKIQLGRISPFGLMELSRQRLRPSISETSYSNCPHCKGTGLIRMPASLGIEIIRALEYEASSGKYQRIILRTAPEMLEYLLNDARNDLTHIEKTYNIRILVNSDSSLHGSSAYFMDKLRSGEPGKQRLRNKERGGNKTSSREDKDATKTRRGRSRKVDDGAGKGRTGKRSGGDPVNSMNEDNSAEEESTTDRNDESGNSGDGTRSARRRSYPRKQRSGGNSEEKNERVKKPATRSRTKKLQDDETKNKNKSENESENKNDGSSNDNNNDNDSNTPTAANENPIPGNNPVDVPTVADTNNSKSKKANPPRRGWWNRNT